MIKVVVIGGGTGSYSVLSGLKKYPIELSAVVCTTDSGGSTGRLRDEFGFLPVGDFRMALVALAPDDDSDNLLRKLLLYRFDKGDGLKGHNFGNLFLTALNELFGSQEDALTAAGKILNIRGAVIPVTKAEATLMAKYSDNSVIIGESSIDEPPATHDTNLKVTRLYTEPKVRINEVAYEAIIKADFLVLGPGDLYTSIFANLVIEGTREAIRNSKAKKIFVINLVTKSAQTTGFKTSDFVSEYRKYATSYPDFVLINNSPLPKDIVKKYEVKGEFPIEDDLASKTKQKLPFKIIRADVLAKEEVIKPSGDVLKRSFLRHDPDKLSKTLMRIFLS